MLVATFEVEGRAIGAGVYFGIAKLNQFRAACDRLPYVVIGVQVIARLVHVRQFNGVTNLDRARIRLFLTGKHLEKGRFAGTVGADHADNTTGRQREAEVFNKKLVAHGFGQSFNFHHLVAQTLAVGDNDLRCGELFAL